MAADIGTARPYHSGLDADAPETQRYEKFYDQLFRLQDEVFAGRHPRIKLPDSVVQQFAPRLYKPLPSFVVERLARTNASSNGIASNSGAASVYNSSLQDRPLATHIVAQPPTGQQHPPGSKRSSSGIDPVLLEKSETLKRAEHILQLRAQLRSQRERIENALKEAWGQRSIQSRDRSSGCEGESTLDVSQILEKAWEIVKPVSGLQPSVDGRRGGSESFDENSYYSSQANSWSSSEDVESAKDGTMLTGTAAASQVDVAQTDDDNHPVSHVPRRMIPSHSSYYQRSEGQMVQLQQLEKQPSTTLHSPDPAELGEDLYSNGPIDARKEREESEEYSPPEADAFAILAQNDQPIRLAGFSLQDHDATMRPPQPIPNPCQPQPPMVLNHQPAMEVPIIQNHIRSPVAPQPARISPLTFTSVPRVEQLRTNEETDDAPSGPPSPRHGQTWRHARNGAARAGRKSPKNSGRHSPAAPRQSINNPRKRRRGGDGDNSQRKTSGKRIARSPERVIRSPEPYIKDEPVSPPPFMSLTAQQPPRRRVVRQLPEDVEIISPREIRTRPVYYRDYDQGNAYRYEVEEPISPGLVRVHSQAAHRRLERDDQDLRRVASLQYHATRPYSPTYQAVPYASADGRPVRAASHAYIERPIVQQPIYRAESVRPVRYVRSERSRSPPQVVDPYAPRIQSPGLMAPPPRPVIVDEYGNKYYAAAPLTERRASVAPSQRLPDGEYYYERPPTRDQLTRAPMRVAESYYEDDAMQRMPPPLSRRLVEQPDMDVVDPRVYHQRGYSLRPPEPAPAREEFMAPSEAVDRRPGAAYQDMAAPREYVQRAHSMRPEVVRSGIPVDAITGQESIQPGQYARRVEGPTQAYREFSARRGDYMPVEERGYSYAPQPQFARTAGEVYASPRSADAFQDVYAGDGGRIGYRY